MPSTPNMPPARAANDTEVPSTLPIGGEYATPHWRIHRSRSSVTITHLDNAGKRGKTCMILQVSANGRDDDEALDLFVSYLLQVIVDNPRPETLAAVAQDAKLLSTALSTTVAERRGVDVEVDPIKIEADLLQAFFAPQELRITVTAIMDGPKGSFRQDSHLYNADRRSAKVAYAWARKSAARIGTMTRSEIYAALHEAGARVNTWG